MSTYNTYNIGQRVRMDGAFSQNGSAADPTTVSVILRRPDGIKVTKTYGTDAEVVRASQGNYYMEYVAVIAGPHWYRFVSTGNVEAADELMFSVRPSNTTE